MKRLAWCVGLACAIPAFGAPEPVLGPARDVALVEDFGAASAAHWRVRQGANVAATHAFGRTLPGVAVGVLKLTAHRTDRTDREPSRNWVALTRTAAPAPRLPDDFDGFRVVLGGGAPAQWWISMSVAAADGKTYSRLVLDAVLPSGRMVEHLLPVETFRAGGVPLSAEAARSVRSIEFACSVPGGDLYFDRITLYRRSRHTGWLTFSTNRPAHNLFEPGERAEIVLTPGGSIPSGAAGVRFEVRRLDGSVALKGVRRLSGASPMRIAAPFGRHGYYEVRAWWADQTGRSMGTESCIRAEGTVPTGLGTFAILPRSVAENRAMFARVGRRASFGLHGDFMGLADRIGLAWRLGYEKWPWLEPVRPDRSMGPADWARKRMAEGPEPPYSLHILPFRGNMGEEVPAWARAPEGVAPPFASWDDYLAMVRDCVEIEKRRYPRMAPRLYGCAWEANLNMPPYNATPPPHTPAQIVELFRRTREAIRSADPTGLVLGPCPSVMQTAWFETMFEAGIGAFIDGIETHGYSEDAFDPEDNDFPGKIERLNALSRKHTGRPLPIYCTEIGQPGILGATIEHRSQADRMVRACIILKGEGVRVTMPFYGIDYDRLGYWGFLFNLDVDAPAGPWVTCRVMPKPMVTTVAACVRILEGTRPVRRLTGLGPSVWAYTFADAGRRVTAIWAPRGRRTVALTVGRGPARLLDAEGHVLPIVVRAGRMRIAIGPSPVYLVESVQSR
jgi:hypothetical protein